MANTRMIFLTLFFVTVFTGLPLINGQFTCPPEAEIAPCEEISDFYILTLIFYEPNLKNSCIKVSDFSFGIYRLLGAF